MAFPLWSTRRRFSRAKRHGYGENYGEICEKANRRSRKYRDRYSILARAFSFVIDTFRSFESRYGAANSARRSRARISTDTRTSADRSRVKNGLNSSKLCLSYEITFLLTRSSTNENRREYRSSKQNSVRGERACWPAGGGEQRRTRDSEDESGVCVRRVSY